MVEIIKIERKRIMNIKVFLVFLVIVTLFSAYNAYSVSERYEIPGPERMIVTWRENLTHAKTNLQGKYINREFLSLMRQSEREAIYADERNLEELVAANYEGKSVRELSDDQIRNFYLKRLSNIRQMLEKSRQIQYTQEEIERFMKSAHKVTEIQTGYAEGWKALIEDMGIFISILLILISIFLLPLFGTDPKSDMRELYRAAKYGKMPLDHARIAIAFIIGIFLYASGILLFLVIHLLFFGLGGWDQCIQSNAPFFFSLYNITNLQQFLLNVMIGFIALLFDVSLLRLITVFMEKVMTSAVVLVFFWILLLLFDQMCLWPVNHYFANFMPLKMTSFTYYYIDNEIYRVFGYSLSAMNWCIMVSAALSGILLLAAEGYERIRRKRGLY